MSQQEVCIEIKPMRNRRLCVEPGCNKSAEGKTDKCKGHGGGKRCKEPGCDKSAEGKTDKCAAHGGGERCPNCIDWIDSRSGSTAYDGYCATCFTPFLI